MEEEKSDHKEKKKTLTYDEKLGINKINCKKQDPLTHENDKFHIFPNTSVRIMLCGASGTGKSYLLSYIIPMLHKPTHIVVATTVNDNDVHEGIREYCKEFNIKYHCVTEPKIFKSLSDDIINCKKPKDHVIFIFDDFSTYKTSKDEAHNNSAVTSFSKNRNYNVSSIIVSPSFTDIKTNCRNSATCRIIFPMDDSQASIKFNQDLKKKFKDMPQDLIDRLNKYIDTHIHTFILWTNHPHPQIRLGFENVIFPNGDTKVLSESNIESDETKNESQDEVVTHETENENHSDSDNDDKNITKSGGKKESENELMNQLDGLAKTFKKLRLKKKKLELTDKIEEVCQKMLKYNYYTNHELYELLRDKKLF